MLDGKRVLVTGGTGSLGTAILERAEREKWDTQFTVFARNETKINQTKFRFPSVDCRVGDVQDLGFLRTIFPDHDCIIHAAAQKIVPLAENNVRTSVLVNVIGTLAVCQAAVESGIKQVVTILTDKMVSATNSYGASKFLAGALTREANTWGKTQFNCVRYGNVLGSNNSLLPLLLKQKAEGKPFTITEARCTRFWLTLDQSIDLILMGFEQNEPATTVVPKAPASPVIDLFRAVDPEWEVVDIGIRPGEKIHESLIDPVEARCTIDKGEYFIVYPPQSKVESNLPFGYSYTSDNPYKQLSIEELKQMMGI